MAWTVETVRPLLERFDERVRGDVSRFDRLVEPAEARGTVLRDPATEQDIVSAEKRLGVKLPPSYRSFLLLSDGAYASALGAEVQVEGDWRHGLLPVAEIQRTVDADEIGVQVWCHDIPEHLNPDNDFLPVAGEPKPVRYYSPYENGIVITHIHNGTDRLALVPRRGRDEWELWDFHWEGATAHPSFADFLVWYATRPDRRPKPEQADAMVEAFKSGRAFTLESLAEIGDPRGVELALEAIAEGSTDIRLPTLLMKVRDPATIPALRQLLTQTEGWERVQTLRALEQLGAEGLDQLLQDASRDLDERVRDWALGKLAADI